MEKIKKCRITFAICIVLLFSCCEKPEPVTDINIFLEKNKGVLFEQHNPVNKSRMPYCRFTNNVREPIETWADLVIWGEGCYSHIERTYWSQSREITIDTETEFQVTFYDTYPEGKVELSKILTYKIIGNLLEIDTKLIDTIYASYTTTWTKSSQNIYDLNICDYE